MSVVAAFLSLFAINLIADYLLIRSLLAIVSNRPLRIVSHSLLVAAVSVILLKPEEVFYTFLLFALVELITGAILFNWDFKSAVKFTFVIYIAAVLFFFIFIY